MACWIGGFDPGASTAAARRAGAASPGRDDHHSSQEPGRGSARDSSNVGFDVATGPAGKLGGIHVGRPRRPLGVTGLVGELDHVTQLLTAQVAGVRDGGDLRERLEGPGGLDRVQRAARAESPSRGERGWRRARPARRAPG